MKAPDIIELLKDKIDEDARLNMVKFFNLHGVVEDSWFWENVYTVLPQELKGRVNESLSSSGAIGSDRFLPKEIVETKETFKLLQECLDSLQGEQGHLVYGEEWRECDRSDEHLQLIKKRISEEKTDWKLMLASSSGDHWSWEKSKRTFKQYDVAKIVNEDGAELIFDIQPCDDPDDNWVHVCMFSIPVKKQKGFFQTKNVFKSAAATVAFHPCFRGLYSPCLTSLVGAPSSINDNLKSNKSWRTKLNNYSGADKDEWRLLTFWKRMGFVRPFLENRNPDNIYLFHPDEVLATKKAYLDEGEKNPYSKIKHSVYGPELEQLLRQ